MLEKFPRYPLTFGPTPIEKLNRLGVHLGSKVELYAKREDCNSGLAFGGNKLRKLEYIIPDAIASNADTLVSIGGVQSNHTRMVAAVAAKIGMKCHLVQESWVPHEDAVYDRVGNIMLSRVMGADVRLVDGGFDIGIRKSWERAIAEVKAKGGRPYAIPAGASVHKYGGLGYVRFAEEVRKEEKTLGFASTGQTESDRCTRSLKVQALACSISAALFGSVLMTTGTHENIAEFVQLIRLRPIAFDSDYVLLYCLNRDRSMASAIALYPASFGWR
jgi:1-aminocyclopropane-1-carboxylate deaminase